MGFMNYTMEVRFTAPLVILPRNSPTSEKAKEIPLPTPPADPCGMACQQVTGKTMNGEIS
jgi:hypothetical protein